MSEITIDLIWQILLNLPAESIHHCRTVCKSWRKLIESPAFIKAQLEKTSRSNTIDSRLIIVSGNGENKFSSFVFHLPENQNVVTVKKMDHPIPKDNKKRRFLIGSSNGLICLQNTLLPDDVPSIATSFTFWNPSTGIHRIVDDKSDTSPVNSGKNIINWCCYFGYDPIKDDYHVVRVTKLAKGDGFLLYVYSLKNDSWTKIHNQDLLEKEWVIHVYSGVFISGTLYLLTRKCVDSNSIHHRIISFDISNQSFKLIDLPPAMKKSVLYILGELQGRLRIMGSTPRSQQHVLWLMMNDKCWKKIEIQTSKPLFYPKILHYCPEQVLALGYFVGESMELCDLKTKTSKETLAQRSSEMPSYKYPCIIIGRACVCLKTIASPFIL